MEFKNILKKIIKTLFSKNNKIESNDCYCYSNIIWNDTNSLIILISFTKDYFEQIIEVQDAINNIPNLRGAIVFSSYDEEITKEDNNIDLITHKKYYMLIGGSPLVWQKLYMNIHNLSNIVLGRIADEICYNCNYKDFELLINDGIFNKFNKNNNVEYDMLVKTKNGYSYIDPEVLIKKLPNGFTGRDIIKFIEIYEPDNIESCSALSEINKLEYLNNSSFKEHDLYPLYAALFKNPTIEKLKLLLEPLYKQPDDDAIPGDISDESLDEIFKIHYERFSAITDDNIYYEDIDEIISDDE